MGAGCVFQANAINLHVAAAALGDKAVCDSQAFHSEHEVMASDHVETHLQPAASIVSKCRIHTLEQYMVSSVAQHPSVSFMVLQ